MNYLASAGLGHDRHRPSQADGRKAPCPPARDPKCSHGRPAELATELAKQSITIEANANDEGHLYGSVGASEIVAALKRNEITITADQVRLKGPLKELGLYTVNIHLGHEIEAELKVGSCRPCRRAREAGRKEVGKVG